MFQLQKIPIGTQYRECTQTSFQLLGRAADERILRSEACDGDTDSSDEDDMI